MQGSISVTWVPFSGLAGQPRTFLQYLENSPVRRFYRQPPTLEGLLAAAGAIRSLDFPRTEICNILRRQTADFGGDDSVTRSIDDLAKSDSVAILTGQQAGLFSGPALTVYKAMTALRLSAVLREKGLRAVPVFWIASDDHDLEEITKLAFPDTQGNIVVQDARKPLFGKQAIEPLPVGAIELPGSISGIIQEYCSTLPATAGPEVERMLRTAYRPGETFARSFGRLLADLFRGRGLIIFDPRDAKAKKIAQPVFLAALRHSGRFRTQLRENAQSLMDAGLKPQVSILPKSTLVFWEDEAGRRLALAENDGFLVKDAGRRFSTEEMLNIAENAPERLSPNVLLRPLVQDHLFPTVAYVGGPAETSYFAQIGPLYGSFGRPMPVVWPRMGFTVLGADCCDILDKYGLSAEECLAPLKQLLAAILGRRPPAYQAPVDNLRRTIETGMANLEPGLNRLDPTLICAAATVRNKLLMRAESIRIKMLNGEWNSNDELRADLSRLSNEAFPAGHLQERELSFPFLIAHHGPALLDTLMRHCDVESFGHKVICFRSR